MAARRPGPRRASDPRRRGRRPAGPERLALGPPGRVAARPRAGPRRADAPRQPSELIIGRHPIDAALRSGRRLHRLMVAEGADGAGVQGVLRLATERSVGVQVVPRERLDALADHHQGIIAEAAPYQYVELEDLLASVSGAPPERPALLVAV